MRRAIVPLLRLFWPPLSRRSKPRPAGRRPGLEELEHRLTPANASSVISGAAVVGGSFAVPGVTVTLTGTTTNPQPTLADSNNALLAINVTNGGTGYTTAPTVTIAAPPSGSTATAVATVANGVVTGITVTFGGSGYTTAPLVTIAPPPTSGSTTATAVATVPGTSVKVTAVTNSTGHYEFDNVEPGIYTLSYTGLANYTGTASDPNKPGLNVFHSNFTVSGAVGSVQITNGGSGYTSAPMVTFSGGGGSGAVGTAVIKNGVVVGVTITNPGSGYTSLPSVTFSAPTSGTTATGTVVTDVPNVTSQNISFGFLQSNQVSNNLLYGLPLLTGPQLPKAGSGVGAAAFRANNSPTVTQTNVTVNGSDTVDGTHGGSNSVDLNGVFSDPDIGNSLVQFNVSINGVAQSFQVKLFDSQAPQTVANFLDYIAAGDYNNALFTRLVQGFVLQGGGASATTSTTTGINLNPVPTLNSNIAGLSNGTTVPSEFSSSNAAGNSNSQVDTLAMALPGADSNGGSKEFFFNLGNNSNLDPQDFTVFGQIVPTDRSKFANMISPTNFPSNANGGGTNENTSTGITNLPVDVSNFPVDTATPLGTSGTTFASNASLKNVFLINSIQVLQRPENLSYTVDSITDPSGVLKSGTLQTGKLANGYLPLVYNTGVVGTVTLTVHAIDEFGAVSGESTITVDVDPATPVVTAVSITPTSTGTGVTNDVTGLTASATVSAADGATPTLNYQWFQNGTAIPNATSQSLDLTALSVNGGDKFTVQVTPTNTVGTQTATGTTFTSNPVTTSSIQTTITLAAPVVSSVTIAPDSLSNATTLTARATTSDGTAVSFGYQWSYTLNGNTTVLTNSGTSQTLNLAAAASQDGIDIEPGGQFSVQVTPTDATGSGTPVTSTLVAVAAVNGDGTFAFDNPVVTGVTIAPDSVTAATSLTATASGPATSFSYQWSYTPVGSTTPITLTNTSATTATLNLAATAIELASLGYTIQAGDRFSVQVTPVGTSGNGTPVTSTPLQVAAVNGDGTDAFNDPVVTGVTIAPNSVPAAASLTATASGTTAGGGTPSFAYQWLQNGMAISGATSQTLNLGNLTIHANDQFTVQVTPSDGGLTGAAFTSNAVTVGSTSHLVILAAPTVASATIQPDNPASATTLTAIPISNDGTAVSFSHQWQYTQQGVVGTVTIANGGSGYTSAPTVTFSAPGGSGTTATGVAVLGTGANAGHVVGITITNTGSGYTSPPTITIAAPTSGTRATATSTLTSTTINLVTASGATASAATVSLNLAGAAAELNGLGNVVGTIAITNGGSGYSSVPNVTFSAPASGTPATGVAVLGTGANAGQVVGITITNPGSGYTSAPTITIDPPASGTPATATAAITSAAPITGGKFSDLITPSDATGSGPVFTSNAVAATVSGSGASATFSFTAPVVNSVNIQMTGTKLTATPPPPPTTAGNTKYTYLWLHNGQVVPFQTSSTLDLTKVANVKANDTFAVLITPFTAGVQGTRVTSKAVTITSVIGSGANAVFNISVPAASTIAVNPLSNGGVSSVTITSGGSNSLLPLDTVTFSAPVGPTNGNTTNLSTSLTNLTTNTANLRVGMQVTGAGIPANTTIKAINSANSITISNAATATGLGVALTFGTTATGTAIEVNSSVVGVAITNPGSGYTAPPTVSFTGGGAPATGTAINSVLLTAVPATTPSSGLSFTFQWFQNGTAIPGATAATLDLTTVPSLNATDVFSVQVTPNNGTTTGLATNPGQGTPVANVFIKNNNLGSLLVG